MIIVHYPFPVGDFFSRDCGIDIFVSILEEYTMKETSGGKCSKEEIVLFENIIKTSLSALVEITRGNIYLNILRYDLVWNGNTFRSDLSVPNSNVMYIPYHIPPFFSSAYQFSHI